MKQKFLKILKKIGLHTGLLILLIVSFKFETLVGSDIFTKLYLSLKAVHIISVISFMAGMLYLPRLFVYHSMQEIGSETDGLLAVMENRLLKYIISPALVATLATGLSLSPIFLHGSGNYWLHAKFFLVVLMIVTYGFCRKFKEKFSQDTAFMKSRSFRIFNEVPTLIMIAIVILVTVKPF